MSAPVIRQEPGAPAYFARWSDGTQGVVRTWNPVALSEAFPGRYVQDPDTRQFYFVRDVILVECFRIEGVATAMEPLPTERPARDWSPQPAATNLDPYAQICHLHLEKVLRPERAR